MAFVKPNIIATTLLTPELFNTLETQYDEVISYWGTTSFRMANEELAVESLAAAPSHGAGRIYFNSTDGEIYVSDGAAWHLQTEYAEVVV